MLPRLPRDLTIRLDPQTIAIKTHDLPVIPCRACGAGLSVHQPEPESSESLLGTCGACGAWHFIGLAPTGEEAVVLPLPTVSLIRRALTQTDGAPAVPDAPDLAGGPVA